MFQIDPAPDGETDIYECLVCGSRAENPESRRCDCGGPLKNISVPRPE